MNKNPDSIEEEFDFGFSFADENYEEIKESSEELQEKLTKEVEDLKRRLDLLHNSILPFLDNLCKHPEKTTINWPNRVEKIEQYKKKLQQIVEGNHE